MKTTFSYYGSYARRCFSNVFCKKSRALENIFYKSSYSRVETNKIFRALLTTSIGVAFSYCEQTKFIEVDENDFLSDQPISGHFPYVIIGTGTAAVAAIEGILQQDPGAEILMLAEEAHVPKTDVALGTVLDPELKSSFDEWRRPVSSYLDKMSELSGTVTLRIVRNPLKIDIENRVLHLDDDEEDISFERCLIATDGKPREFYVFKSNKGMYSLRESINTLSSLADFELLNEACKADDVEHAVVVGGGFLGTEVALLMSQHGIRVSHVYAEPLPLARHLPTYLCNYISAKLQEQGVQPISNRLVSKMRVIDGMPDQEYQSRTESVFKRESKQSHVRIGLISNFEETLLTHYVVMASTHIDPITGVAKSSGLEIDSRNGGVVVNRQLEAASGIYGAGGCISYIDPILGRRRIDLLDHSVNSGLVAGYNMAITRLIEEESELLKSVFLGEKKERQNAVLANVGVCPYMYTHIPTFKSYMKGIGVQLEGVGEISSSLHSIGIWMDPEPYSIGGGVEKYSTFHRGIVYYLQGRRVVGALMWNASEQLESVRNLLEKGLLIDNIEDLPKHAFIAPDDWLYFIESNSYLAPRHNFTFDMNDII